MTVRPAVDDATISEAKAGSTAAWHRLYETAGGRLVVWLRAQPHLDPALDADDIAHDTWVTAAGKIADFHGTVDQFTGWVFGIARNLMVNTNRRSVRRGTVSVEPEQLGRRLVTVDNDSAELAEQLDWTRRTLAQLPDREAQVVACIDVVGLDAAATATALGISATAVRVARHRALRRLRGVMEDPTTGTADRPLPHADDALADTIELGGHGVWPGRTHSPGVLVPARESDRRSGAEPSPDPTPTLPSARPRPSAEEIEPPIGVGTWT